MTGSRSLGKVLTEAADAGHEISITGPLRTDSGQLTWLVCCTATACDLGWSAQQPTEQKAEERARMHADAVLAQLARQELERLRAAADDSVPADYCLLPGSHARGCTCGGGDQ